jgi:secretion/DNA translocation related CpaE-like protein
MPNSPSLAALPLPSGAALVGDASALPGSAVAPLGDVFAPLSSAVAPLGVSATSPGGSALPPGVVAWSGAAAAARPLAVTADPDLLDDLLRVAAAQGVELDVAADPAAARRRWSAAPLVLVGLDRAVACHRAHLPNRPELVLVGRASEGDAPWELAQLLGAARVAMLPAAEQWLAKRFASVADLADSATYGSGSDRRGRLVAVIGGRGGAGASVLSAGIAVTAARGGLRALLVDADPLGGGIDLVLGWEAVNGLRWPALHGASGRVEVSALVRALPTRGELTMISFDRGEPTSLPSEAMAATIDAGRRGRDIIVIDLPRRLDEAAILALQSADRALLVVPAELRAAAAAGRVAALARPHCSSLAVVVRGPSPGSLRAKELAAALELPLAGVLRPERGLAAALERGETPGATGRGPLAALSRRIIDDLMGIGATRRAAA